MLPQASRTYTQQQKRQELIMFLGKIKENSAVKMAKGFLNRIKEDHVGAYAAQTAYFLIMSFIPLVLFLATAVRYTPLTYTLIRQVIIGIVPENLQAFVLRIVADIFTQSSAILPITGIVALWSAGKGMQSLINGLNTIYHVHETRGWLVKRIYSVLYTLLFVVALLVSLLALVLGNRIQAAAAGYIPWLGRVIGRIISARTFLVFFVLLMIFTVLYKVLPNRKATIKSQLPGAMITAVAWSLFSYFFSIYFEVSSNFTRTYGNLAAVLMVMLWLYVCMNLLLYGAEINAYFEKQFRQARESVKELLARDKEEETDDK